MIVSVMEDKCRARRWCEVSGIYSGVAGAAHLSRAKMFLVAKKCKEHSKFLTRTLLRVLHPPTRPLINCPAWPMPGTKTKRRKRKRAARASQRKLKRYMLRRLLGAPASERCKSACEESGMGQALIMRSRPRRRAAKQAGWYSQARVRSLLNLLLLLLLPRHYSSPGTPPPREKRSVLCLLS